jgi:uncharacterized OsmC-like protein
VITIGLDGKGDCVVSHAETGTTLRTSKSPAFGGTGESFSSTDLLGIALGTCIATDLEPVALRHGVALETIQIEVDKLLSVSPKRVEAFAVTVRIDQDVPEDILLRLRRAADACLVQRALHPDVRCTIVFERAP